MKKRKIYLFIILALLFYSCNNKYETEEASVLFEYLPCMEPVTACGIEYFSIDIFKTPDYLKKVFRFVINEEKKCICFDETYTIFSIYFKNEGENHIKLGIYPISNILKQNLTYEIYGGFYFENHFFLIADNSEVDCFEYISNFSFAKFKIKEKNDFSDIDDSKSEFVFLGEMNNGDWKLIHHFNCKKNEQ